ncbi:MAG: putative Ig domain-containing protein, partial [Candidatus Acidiferrum sp.]
MKRAALCVCLGLVLACFGCSGGSQPASLTLSTGLTQAIDNGQSVNIMVSGAGTQGVTWSLSGPGSLSNQTSTSVTYNAPAVGAIVPAKAKASGAKAQGTFSVGADPTATVTATSVASASQSASVTISVMPPPSITTTSLPAGTEGTAYNQSIATSGGAGTLALTVSTGTLPAGLNMDSSGHITGMPTGPNGTASFTVKVTDSSNGGAQSATQNLSITINLPSAPTITTTSLPTGVEGTAYNQTIAATGGLTPYTFSVSVGTLPAGLALSSGTGAITGTPTGPNGASNFTVKLTDKSNPAQSATQILSITINLPPAPVISPTTLPNGNVGSAYTQMLSVSGGLGPAFTWTVSSGTLPAGLALTFTNATAKISGTPTTTQTSVAFTIQVTDSSVPPQSGTQSYTVTINPPAPLSITTTSLTNGVYSTAYSAAISATGGIAPYTYSLDAASSPLPAGLALSQNNNQGVISGTPTTAGVFTNFIIDVHDSQTPTPATAKMTFTLTITASAIVISPSSLPAGTVN